MQKKEIGNYTVERELDQGGFSKVYLARHNTIGENVAIKRIRKENYEREKILREVKLMQSLDHPFTVQFYEFIEDDTYYYIVMEYVRGTTLLDLVNHSGKIPEWKIRHIFVELISTVQYLHDDLKMAHRDIKLENIIFDTYGNIRLIDFGLGNTFQQTDGILQTACGSPAYAPPEMFLRRPYTNAADIWSAGCVIYALSTNALPFDEPNAKLLASKIVYQSPTFPDDLKPSLVELISDCLNKDSAERPLPQDIYKYEWVSVYPNSQLFAPEFGIAEGWRNPTGNPMIDEAIVNELNHFGIDSTKGIEDYLAGRFTTEAAVYRILKRQKVTFQMEKLYEEADISMKATITRKQHLSLTPNALTPIRRPSPNTRNKFSFGKAMNPVTGVSRFSATVKLSNRMNSMKPRVIALSQLPAQAPQ